MSPDPGTDRHLDDDIVRSLLREQFPELADEPVAYFAEGWDNQVYLVGDDWLFRFPKRAGVVAWIEREIAVMPHIERYIGVPVPHFEKFGDRSEAFPYPFVGYRRLPGTPAEEADDFDETLVARSLGSALANLHSIDPSLLPPAPPDDEPDEPPTTGPPVHVIELLPPSLRAAARAYVHGDVPCPEWTGPPRVIHNDMAPEHVLVDEATGALTGIIDFADLWNGDPAGDFAGLSDFGGFGFVRAALETYSIARDVTFVERVQWRARMLHLHWLAEAVTVGTEIEECCAAVVTVFEEELW